MRNGAAGAASLESPSLPLQLCRGSTFSAGRSALCSFCRCRRHSAEQTIRSGLPVELLRADDAGARRSRIGLAVLAPPSLVVGIGRLGMSSTPAADSLGAHVSTFREERVRGAIVFRSLAAVESVFHETLAAGWKAASLRSPTAPLSTFRWQSVQSVNRFDNAYG